MDRRAFLKEEWKNIKRALKETLRHDFLPHDGQRYYEECSHRLQYIDDDIQEGGDVDAETVAAHIEALAKLGVYISLIERSHLGEFSWPFTANIRAISTKLLARTDISGNLEEPIVHIIADAAEYRIYPEKVTDTSRRRFAIITFPRHRKHLVLMHAIFGHELGHAALVGEKLIGTNARLGVEALRVQGPLQDVTQANAWLRRNDAPSTIKAVIAANPDFVLSEQTIKNWQIELFCDVFGTVVFGPAFAAAHRAILESRSSNPYQFAIQASTHPPYAIRRRIVVAALKHLGFATPVCKEEDGNASQAEKSFMDYVTEDRDGEWSSIVEQDHLAIILDHIRTIFKDEPHLIYSPPERVVLNKLLDQLKAARPPLQQDIDHDNSINLGSVKMAHNLYAGWSCWLGKEHLKAAPVLEAESSEDGLFLVINRLCDHALLQQQAADIYARAAR